MVETRKKKKMNNKRATIPFYAPIRTKEELIEVLNREDMSLEDLEILTEEDEGEEVIARHCAKMLRELQKKIERNPQYIR